MHKKFPYPHRRLQDPLTIAAPHLEPEIAALRGVDLEIVRLADGDLMPRDPGSPGSDTLRSSCSPNIRV
jgi:hypothetical protein